MFIKKSFELDDFNFRSSPHLPVTVGNVIELIGLGKSCLNITNGFLTFPTLLAKRLNIRLGDTEREWKLK